MRALLAAAAAAVLVVAGCGGAPGRHSRRAHPHAAASAPLLLTARQACERLLADVRRPGGVPDVPTLRRIADGTAAPRLAADARTAVRDIEHTGVAPLAFALLRSDCARAGVHIAAP